MSKLRDQILLLLAGVLFAGIAAALFHWGGTDSIAIFLAIGMFVVSADNRRLRQEIKKLRDGRSV